MPAPVLIFSHGFGVQKDDRGLFPDIAAAFAQYQPIMFDYNSVDPDISGNLTARPFSHQVRLLQAHVATVRTQAPAAPITLVCHSQGCVTAAVAELAGVERVVCLTPPDRIDVDRSVERWSQRPGSSIDLTGVSHLARADGSVTRVPADVWQEMRVLAPQLPELFMRLAERTALHILTAQSDEVLGPTDFSFLGQRARVHALPGDHNFSGPYRPGLLQALALVL